MSAAKDIDSTTETMGRGGKPAILLWSSEEITLKAKPDAQGISPGESSRLRKHFPLRHGGKERLKC